MAPYSETGGLVRNSPRRLALEAEDLCSLEIEVKTVRSKPERQSHQVRDGIDSACAKEDKPRIHLTTGLEQIDRADKIMLNHLPGRGTPVNAPRTLGFAAASMIQSTGGRMARSLRCRTSPWNTVAGLEGSQVPYDAGPSQVIKPKNF